MYTSIPRAILEIVFIIGVSGGLGAAVGYTIAQKKGIVEETETQGTKEDPLIGVDDLKLLHGIDPAIEQVVLKGGIDSFDALSRSTPARLKKILEAGGSAFFAIDTTSWPHQAALANQDRWIDLKKYKVKLAKSKR